MQPLSQYFVSQLLNLEWCNPAMARTSSSLPPAISATERDMCS